MFYPLFMLFEFYSGSDTDIGYIDIFDHLETLVTQIKGFSRIKENLSLSVRFYFGCSRYQKLIIKGIEVDSFYTFISFVICVANEITQTLLLKTWYLCRKVFGIVCSKSVIVYYLENGYRLKDRSSLLSK